MGTKGVEPVAATVKHLENAAARATADPARLAQAARICRIALQRGLLKPDLTPVADESADG